MYKIFLISQPNSGKTTLFNKLTSQQCYVANWPGKTVEVFQAKIEHHGKEILVVDLPGINSFKTLSKEEEITKEYIFKGKDGVAVIVVNGNALFKSLYFAIQVLELKSEAVVVINKADFLEKSGIHVNVEILAKHLGVDVILISALRGIGLNQLIDRCLDVLEGRKKNSKLKINYGSLEPFIEKAEKIVGDRGSAIKALEGDEFILTRLQEEERREIENIAREISEIYGNPEEIIAMHRFRFVEELISSSIKEVKISKVSFGKKLDEIFFSNFGPILAILILFFAIFSSFSINTGFPLNLLMRSIGNEGFAETIESYSIVGIISRIFDSISEFLNENLPDSMWKSLLIDGIIPGVGVIASFFPLILILNLLMSFIEDSGLMSRLAVTMDRLFANFGLTGKSFFPFCINLACNVPGVMASRILETDSERLRVAISSPFVLCQARLLVIILFTAFFFASPLLQSVVVIFIYLLSALLFLFFAAIYREIFKKEKSELLIELPPYHFPSLRVSWWITWTRSKAFIFKVGKIILLFSIFIWFLNSFGLTVFLGKLIAKAFSPIGIESSELGFALLVGFIAKEMIISSLAISFGTSNIFEILSQLGLSMAQAFALIIFISFYTPCIATLAAIYYEIRNLKILLISIVFQLLFAYFLTIVTYTILTL
ncbi:MAG: ferrous iron transport protein B [Archaeoglobaceae archaeon]